MKALLTNDDGYQSHALIPTIYLLQSCGFDVVTIVPDGQRSGYSKATTRRGKLKINQIILEGTKVLTLSGTPADCSNYGIFRYNPDIVVSGANLGSNLDIGHYFSSGTIGAALEAVLLGKPAIAISLCNNKWEYNIEEITTALNSTAPLIQAFRDDQPSAGISVNIPVHQSFTKFFPAELGNIKIKSLFEEKEDNSLIQRKQQWVYDTHECEKGTDRWALAQGVPTVTGIDRRGLPLNPKVIDKWLRRNNLRHELGGD